MWASRFTNIAPHKRAAAAISASTSGIRRLNLDTVSVPGHSLIHGHDTIHHLGVSHIKPHHFDHCIEKLFVSGMAERGREWEKIFH